MDNKKEEINFDGLSTNEAKVKITKWLEEKGVAKTETNYKLRDWLISRQRYWGAPIPVIWKERREADKVLAVYGIGNKPRQNWFPWLDENINQEFLTPEFPTSNLPVLEEWIEVIKEQKLSENSSIVGHSLGCFAALKYAENNKIKQLVLVAPTNTASKEYWDEVRKNYPDFPTDHLLEKFYTSELDVERVIENVEEIVFIFSSDDPYIFGETQKQYENQFGKYDNVEIKILFNRHHMGAEIGCKEFPELLEYFGPKQYKVLEGEDLPLLLPEDVDFIPKGYSPLSRSKEYVDRIRAKYGQEWTPEFDTMDTFVCSSWYFFRFLNPKNEDVFAKTEELDKWLPVDLYMIGAEHIVLHLMYARFFTKFIHDLGLTKHKEPFQKMRHMGMILGPDHRKMSKRWGNVINPNDVIEKYGADTLRMYEMFMGPLDQPKAWNEKSVQGVRRFLDRVYKISNSELKIENEKNSENEKINIEVNKLIKKITEDTADLKFNTAVAKFMEFINFVEKQPQSGHFAGVTRDSWEKFILLLAPYAPFLSDYIWQDILGYEKSVHLEAWPKYDESLLSSEKITVAVQVMGKTRATVDIDSKSSEDQVVEVAKENQKVAGYLADGYKKVIYVPGKIINFII